MKRNYLLALSLALVCALAMGGAAMGEECTDGHAWVNEAQVVQASCTWLPCPRPATPSLRT